MATLPNFLQNHLFPSQYSLLKQFIDGDLDTLYFLGAPATGKTCLATIMMKSFPDKFEAIERDTFGKEKNKKTIIYTHDPVLNISGNVLYFHNPWKKAYGQPLDCEDLVPEFQNWIQSIHLI